MRVTTTHGRLALVVSALTGMTWELHPGRNRLEMRVRNTAGVLGPVSYLEVEN